jgi:hypothetical protein
MYVAKSYFLLRNQSLEARVADSSSGSKVGCLDEKSIFLSEEEIE